MSYTWLPALDSVKPPCLDIQPIMQTSLSDFCLCLRLSEYYSIPKMHITADRWIFMSWEKWSTQRFESMPVSLSWVTAAVSPTPEEPRPVVETAKGATFIMARSIWDFATPGSPTSRQLMSPLRWVPFAKFLSRPAFWHTGMSCSASHLRYQFTEGRTSRFTWIHKGCDLEGDVVFDCDLSIPALKVWRTSWLPCGDILLLQTTWDSLLMTGRRFCGREYLLEGAGGGLS